MNGVQSKLKGKDLDFLFEAILKLEDINECYNFFEDICTISELIESISAKITCCKNA